MRFRFALAGLLPSRRRSRLGLTLDQTTLCEERKRAWGGMPKAYRITQPVLRKQWKPIARFKRKAS